MKIQKTRKIVGGAGVFTLALAAATQFTATASAQTNANGNYSVAPAQTTRVVERDDDTDFGWLGLLGLAGLAGLLRKPKQVVVDRPVETTNRARA